MQALAEAPFPRPLPPMLGEGAGRDRGEAGGGVTTYYLGVAEVDADVDGAVHTGRPVWRLGETESGSKRDEGREHRR